MFKLVAHTKCLAADVAANPHFIEYIVELVTSEHRRLHHLLLHDPHCLPSTSALPGGLEKCPVDNKYCCVPPFL